VFRVILSPSGQFFMLGTAFALAVAIVGIGAVRYRGTRNPSALFLTTGFAVLAANILLVIVWSGLYPAMQGAYQLRSLANVFSPPLAKTGREVLGWWFVGWLGAGTGLLVLRPWWDRRGRRPLDPKIAGAAALGITVLLDALVAVATRAAPGVNIPYNNPTDFNHAFLHGLTVFSVRTTTPGVVGWCLGIAAMIMVLAAAARLIRRPMAQLLAGLGASVAVIGLGFQLQRVDLATGLFRWVDLTFVAALALVFGAMLVDERTDHTRMRRATDRARAVMGGRAEIASMLGHEVKGPVATIRGLAATTLTHYERLSDAERREFLSLIEQESRKLLVTVDQASLGMKVDAHTLSFITHPTDLAVVVRDVLDGFDPGSHLLTFDAPEPAATATVDRKWLAEALRQLVVNAATYSPAQAPIRIVVRRLDGATAAIDVIDQGPGIPTDKREAVFEKFAAYRPPGYEDVAGTGLGLFIARGIARAHGGDIHFSDRPSGGTMLSIRLPTEGPTGGTA
jgi:signal transduction histidine kinase